MWLVTCIVQTQRRHFVICLCYILTGCIQLMSVLTLWTQFYSCTIEIQNCIIVFPRQMPRCNQLPFFYEEYNTYVEIQFHVTSLMSFIGSLGAMVGFLDKNLVEFSITLDLDQSLIITVQAEILILPLAYFLFLVRLNINAQLYGLKNSRTYKLYF